MPKKERFKKYLARRFFIRFHMSIILIGTILSGLLAGKILLAMHVESIIIRYPLVVSISYLAFFLFVRIWLLYIKFRDTIIDSAVDILDVLFRSHSSQSESPIQNVTECGSGEFGGAGASGSFEIPGEVISKGSSSVVEKTGEAGAGLLEEGAVILVPLMIILAVLCGAGIFLIYEAPVILTEAAFQFILAGALLKKAKEIDSPGWIGSVFKNTWIPFVCTLFLSIVGGLFLSAMYPGITHLAEVFSR